MTDPDPRDHAEAQYDPYRDGEDAEPFAPLTLAHDEYHDLRQPDRDHLLAAALYTAKHGDPPILKELNSTVGQVTDARPANVTTSRSVDRLTSLGYVTSGEPDSRARSVEVTDAGYRVLARGAARLDAAATVGRDA